MKTEKESKIWDCNVNKNRTDLKNSILSNVEKNEKNVEKVTNDILKLDTEDILDVIIGILEDDFELNPKPNDEMYIFLEKLLSQKCFNEYRVLLSSVFDEEENDKNHKIISEFEEKYNIKIIDSEK